MKIKSLVTAILGISLILPVMAQTDLASQDVVIDNQERRLIFNEESSQLQTQSAGTLAGPHFEYMGSTTTGGTVFYMDGRVVTNPNSCSTTINGAMRVIVTVTDDLGTVDYHATQGTTNKWSAFIAGNSYKCGVSIGISALNGVGTYEAVYERTGYAPVKERMDYLSACGNRDLTDLFAQRRPYDTNFYPSVTLKQYNVKIAEGFTEAYGVIGKVLGMDLYNGKRKLTIGMERYWNPVMTSYAASIDIRDQESHPAWQHSGPLGHIFTKQYNGTVPLYRGLGVYQNGQDWEIGITTDYNFMQYMLNQGGWQPLGTVGNPQAVLGYVCPAN